MNSENNKMLMKTIFNVNKKVLKHPFIKSALKSNKMYYSLIDDSYGNRIYFKNNEDDIIGFNHDNEEIQYRFIITPKVTEWEESNDFVDSLTMILSLLERYTW